jgi:hypothetical protein
LIPPLCQKQGVLVRRDRFAHQGTLGVRGPHRQVGLRDFGLHQQAGALQQRFA